MIKRLNFLIILSCILVIVLINKFTNFSSVLLVLLQLLLPLLYGIVLSWILNPAVNYFEKIVKNRVLAVVCITLLIILAISGIMYLLIPVIISQSQLIVQDYHDFDQTLIIVFDSLLELAQEMNLDGYIQNFINDNFGSVEVLVNNIKEYGASIVETMLNLFNSVVSFLITTFLTVIITWYLLIDFENIKISLFKKIPSRFYNDVMFLLSEFDKVVIGYFKSYTVISIIVGIMSYIFFIIIGLEAPLLLAVIIALANFIPYFGPYIGALPAVLFAVNHGWTIVLVTGIGITVIQQIDANFLKPKLMGKRTYLSPVAILMSVVIFGSLWGFIGFLIAIPLMSMLKILIIFIYYKVTDTYPEILK